MKKQLSGVIALLGATVIWGSAFIAQSVGMDKIGPFTFQAVRCFLAVVFLFPASALFSKQIGRVYTDAGKAGFLTAMYIVFVPFLGLFLGQRPGRNALLSLIPAIVGLYLLSCTSVSGINKGDVLLLLCAVAFSVQILLIDRHCAGLDGLKLNCIQALVAAVLSVPWALLTETVDASRIASCWLPLGYAGVLSMGVAYTLQIVGQKRVAPSAAALLMSLESVFAALFGWLLLHETMTGAELLGCLLVFAAVVISQLPEKKE